ncbi:cytochrome c family protein [Minicystis rosea]|nr:cytochrome c family protein [Minicystis rosea]
MRSDLAAFTGTLAIAVIAASCGNSAPPTPQFTKAELMDPQKCQQCHPDHYREWSGSMHAYAADDPVFIAMNARAQRETNGAVGSFCVKCHAPVALAEGATTDGTNIADLPQHLKGVTCYFCHSADEVTDTHNAPINLAADGALRGGITDPVANEAHASKYSPIHDRDRPESATLCGSCHDVVSPLGAHIERTFAEWQGTLFSHDTLGLTCGQCHMAGREGLAAQAPDVGVRRVHGHTFPGVDTALTPFPEMDAQKAAVQSSLDGTLQAALCVKGSAGAATLQVVLDNVGAGHAWPSGSTQDRRAWVELVAYANEEPVYQSGVVPDGTSVMDLVDPDLWLIRDCILDGDGKEVHMFWEAASYDSNQLPGPVTNVQTDPNYYLTHVLRTFPRPTSTPAVIAMPDRVTMRVRLVPIGLDVLDDLVASKDLDPSVRDAMPTFTLGGTDLEWTADTATIKYVDQGQPVLCVTRGLSTGANAAVPAPERTMCGP